MASVKQKIRNNSLYNINKYKGLPKGPISNPGIDSIIAAIYPKTDKLLVLFNRWQNNF